jgi:hypothetical protein
MINYTNIKKIAAIYSFEDRAGAVTTPASYSEGRLFESQLTTCYPENFSDFPQSVEAGITS